jgi:hypothetical protein
VLTQSSLATSMPDSFFARFSSQLSFTRPSSALYANRDPPTWLRSIEICSGVGSKS